ncbi:DNA polymerase [Heliophilum fasciatum]|uniref:DNA polymerase n=1 Tax=Heliophilum fasciatum TaxID=35700 RepID=UPI00105399EA|nr:DNA polymerase [Heliophilum fasciatum]
MKHLSIDIETFSSVDITKAGLYKYVQSPDFEILLFAYSWDFGDVQLVDLAQGERLPQEVVFALADPNVIKHAYNASFEWYCINKFYYSPLPQWRCTMLHGLYCGYTAGLAATAVALGLPEDKRKMSIGSALIRTFCVPKKAKPKTQTTALFPQDPLPNRTMPHHEPEKWQLFRSYCKQDVVTEMEIEKRLSAFPIPEREQHLWVIDQQINAFGVAVDMSLVDGALQCDEIITAELMGEAVRLSGLDNPKSVKQLTKWLTMELGEEVANLKKETVKSMLNNTDDGAAKRMLEIRQELSKTSTKKYVVMKEAACEDGRIRGLLQFYGANRTGRWSSRMVQVQNLPRNYMKTLTHARDCVKAGKVDALKLIYGNIPDTLSQLIRTAFVPAPGHVFLVADFAAIEARIIAWLAGEQWRLEVFATHGKIYEASASQMFGVAIELITKGNPEYELRQKGKVAELALGYQGGPVALISMGALTMGLTEEELPDIVKRWRATNRRIVDLWFSLENAALEVMRTGQPVGVKGMLLAREGDYQNGQDFFTITLPSRRKLFYTRPFLHENDFGKEALHYHGINQKTKKWDRISTYGGKLVENVVQAIARDCLAESLIRLHYAGYKTAMHIHDEVVLDVPAERANLDEVCGIMGQPIEWAPGLVLKADGFETSFYKKD